MELTSTTEWCKLCHNSEQNEEEWLCSLTSKAPSFQDKCSQFQPSQRYLNLYRKPIEQQLLSSSDSPIFLEPASHLSDEFDPFGFKLEKEYLQFKDKTIVTWESIWDVKLLCLDPGENFVYELHIQSLDGHGHHFTLSKRDEDERKCRVLLGRILRILESRNRIFHRDILLDAERYASCEVCPNSKKTKEGYLCSLTSNKPDFEITCGKFEKSLAKVRLLERDYISKDYPVRFKDAEVYAEDEKIPSDLVNRDISRTTLYGYNDEKAEGRILIGMAVFAGIVELIIDYFFPYTIFASIIFSILAFIGLIVVTGDKFFRAGIYLLVSAVLPILIYEEPYRSFMEGWYDFSKAGVQVAALYLIIKGVYLIIYGDTKKKSKYAEVDGHNLVIFDGTGNEDAKVSLDKVWECHFLTRDGENMLLLEKVGEVDPEEHALRFMEALKPGHLLHVIRSQLAKSAT